MSKSNRKITKINRMTNDELLKTISRMEEGQLNTYTDSNGKEIGKQGAPHTSSLYYQHLIVEGNKRSKEGRL